jgi:hypothetical protein
MSVDDTQEDDARRTPKRFLDYVVVLRRSDCHGSSNGADLLSPLESYLTSALGVSLAVFLRFTTSHGFRPTVENLQPSRPLITLSYSPSVRQAPEPVFASIHAGVTHVERSSLHSKQSLQNPSLVACDPGIGVPSEPSIYKVGGTHRDVTLPVLPLAWTSPLQANRRGGLPTAAIGFREVTPYFQEPFRLRTPSR